MIQRIFFVGMLALLCACSPETGNGVVVTVKGEIPDGEMGKTLTHEHILVDFIGADSTGYHRWNREEVVQVVLPYLKEIREMGYKTLVDCSPEYLGRDPVLLKILSDSSGLNILTNTGLYGAMNNKFLPQYVYEETARELAGRWINEWKNGIEDTGIRPGFIKIGVSYDSLPALHEKLVRAAAITHRETGLVIASHTGPWKIAARELEILKEEGVSPEAFIWVHAQREKDYGKYREAAMQGAWVSLDGIREANTEQYVERLDYMRSQNLLGRVLLSHDAGWYSPGEPGGGNFRGYTAIHSFLVPALLEKGFARAQIDTMLIANPARAFTISKQCLPETSVMVVTGGHAYDTMAFTQMFKSFGNVNFVMKEKPEAWKSLMEGEEYDALVFYDMWQEINEAEKQVFLDEFEKGTGMVFLHHSLASHQEWPEYTQLIGGKYYVPSYTEDSSRVSGFKHDITLSVSVLDTDHPVTRGIKGFTIPDEGYSNTSTLPGIHPLLGTHHPDCDTIIGWSMDVKNSRVVYLMGGHDRHACENASFRKLVQNAIMWTSASNE